MSRIVKKFILLTLGVFAILQPACASAANRIATIRHWVAPDHTRVVIDTDEEALFSTEKGERKLSIALEDTAFPDHIAQPMPLNKPGLESVTITALPPAGVKVELALPAQVQTTIFKLKPFQDKPHRIVIDIVLPEMARKESEARERVKITRKDRIIVIDPGHGGEAVGAVGKKGTFEKDVVLAIGKKLQGVLNKRPGYRAFLTRDGDYYVSFRKRMMIAKEYGADLFVSIHADAARNRSARGSSVYCLSTRGASSEAARILALDENLADIVGGVPNGEGGEGSDAILLDMFQTDTINRAKNFGVSLLQSLEKVNHLKFASVQEAPFLVLKLPDIPSILVETAYISNPREEKLLNSEKFQKRLAESIADAITGQLPPLPPVAVIVAGNKQPGQASPVAQADETAAVDREKGGVRTVEAAQAAGTGRDIVEKTKEDPKKDEPKKEPVPSAPVPATEKAPATVKKKGAIGAAGAAPAAGNGRDKAAKAGESPSKAEKPLYYRVRKGDTLGKIAVRHATTIGALLRWNGMKLHDPLYVNRLIRVAAAPEDQKEHREDKTRISERKGATADKTGKVIYRVRKGDTLAIIAKRHGTTAGAIAKLNRLKLSAPLYVDRKLIISEAPAL